MASNRLVQVLAFVVINAAWAAGGCMFDAEGEAAYSNEPKDASPDVVKDQYTDVGKDDGPVHLCDMGKHRCGNQCVDAGDPKFGCAPNVCKPCTQPPYTTAGCTLNECSTTCIEGTKDCNGVKHPDGCEVNILIDPNNCGDCNAVCPGDNVAQRVCENGNCKVGSCKPGFDDCDGQVHNGCETNLNWNDDNCGACGNQCNDGSTSGTRKVCREGQCKVDSCTPPHAHCTQEIEECETDTSTSVEHCGQCHKDCHALAQVTNVECVDSKCKIAGCQVGYDNCDNDPETGCETNTNNVGAHCGACGIACSKINSQNPRCQDGKCVHSPECSPGYGDCLPHEGNGAVDDGCETHLVSLQNCGACGTACDPPHAEGDCSNTICTIKECHKGYADCSMFAWGCETNIMDDRDNCGKCGKTCVQGPNATGVTCNDGTCTQVCIPGYADCNGIDTDGCEVNTQTDTNHCGGCKEENKCNLAHTATHKCFAGKCQIGTCEEGWADCNGIADDGCEANLGDIANCGTCGNKCNYTNATAACSAGTCKMGACNANWGNCNGLEGDGCEVNLASTVAHCGACKAACSLDNTASHSCVSGKCQVAGCNPGWGNCNTEHSDGCEANLNNDVNNCKTCGTGCSFKQATASCESGTCKMGACNGGWGNCNGQQSDGCEANLNEPSHCGSCTTQCKFNNASASCESGTCKMGACNGGWGNCNGQQSDGCEANLNTDPNNCKTCGIKCDLQNTDTHKCNGGICEADKCDPGWGNCDSNARNGCETNLNTDPKNCSNCGANCDLQNTDTHKCNGGICEAENCDPNWYSCDGDARNGCESSTPCGGGSGGSGGADAGG